MSGGAYYNEHDRFAAAWLRGLIRDGRIAPGFVDERDIQDVRADELRGFTQCHFFAGIGGWGLALRLAGWPDDRPVWTGSCPCQPFSNAGKRQAFEDARHLWPIWFRLIRECRPATIFGEQVASADGLWWFDSVSSDLETEAYAVGAADLCAAGVGAPHIRQRLWFVADAGHVAGSARRGSTGVQAFGPAREERDEWLRADAGPGDGCAGTVADSDGGLASDGGLQRGGEHGLVSQGGRTTVGMAYADRQDGSADRDGSDSGPDGRHQPGGCRPSGRMADPAGPRPAGSANGRSDGGASEAEGRTGHLVGGREPERESSPGELGGHAIGRRQGIVSWPSRCDSETRSQGPAQASGLAGSDPWSDLVWLPCRDGKARPTKPGLQPLAHGLPGRVGLIRGAGNAIVPQVAAEFIGAYLDGPPA